ncbi:hypothetical protein [Aestuariibacter sp. A3R04]|uniref:type IV pilus modification PilV family protein n=1 Tax=Aestuariibacter sp. A3R04 TaxID=2841571 RepID=UPI001C08DCFB|nr:hypothetical protein [Aestuariibacter sp. A3R04]MBU3021863.1 hypothetical protein [Aestuariibacter sp. A3R04]
MSVIQPSPRSGMVLLEVLLAMIMMTSVLLGCIAVVQNFQQTSIATSLYGAAMNTAQRYRSHFSLVGKKGFADLPIFVQIAPNAGGLLPPGNNTVNLGPHIAPHGYSVSWHSTEKYTQNANVYTTAQSSGCPYPLIKHIDITVSWQNLDGNMLSYSTQTAISHPLLSAHPDKLFRLDATVPTP